MNLKLMNYYDISLWLKTKLFWFNPWNRGENFLKKWEARVKELVLENDINKTYDEIGVSRKDVDKMMEDYLEREEKLKNPIIVERDNSDFIEIKQLPDSLKVKVYEFLETQKPYVKLTINQHNDGRLYFYKNNVCKTQKIILRKKDLYV